MDAKCAEELQTLEGRLDGRITDLDGRIANLKNRAANPSDAALAAKVPEAEAKAAEAELVVKALEAERLERWALGRRIDALDGSIANLIEEQLKKLNDRAAKSEAQHLAHRAAEDAQAAATAVLRADFAARVDVQTREFQDLQAAVARLSLLPGGVSDDTENRRKRDERRIKSLEKQMDSLRSALNQTWETEKKARQEGETKVALTLQQVRRSQQELAGAFKSALAEFSQQVSQQVSQQYDASMRELSTIAIEVERIATITDSVRSDMDAYGINCGAALVSSRIARGKRWDLVAVQSSAQTLADDSEDADRAVRPARTPNKESSSPPVLSISQITPSRQSARPQLARPQSARHQSARPPAHGDSSRPTAAPLRSGTKPEHPTSAGARRLRPASPVTDPSARRFPKAENRVADFSVILEAIEVDNRVSAAA